MKRFGNLKTCEIYSCSFPYFHGEPEVVIMWKLSKEIGDFVSLWNLEAGDLGSSVNALGEPLGVQRA